jgi:hypothetical protein
MVLRTAAVARGFFRLRRLWLAAGLFGRTLIAGSRLPGLALVRALREVMGLVLGFVRRFNHLLLGLRQRRAGQDDSQDDHRDSHAVSLRAPAVARRAARLPTRPHPRPALPGWSPPAHQA